MSTPAAPPDSTDKPPPDQPPPRPQSAQTPETCAWCAGTGMWAVSAGYVISCIVCGGKGRVSTAQPAGPCHQCAGSGRRNETSPCLNCAGTGWARVFEQG